MTQRRRVTGKHFCFHISEFSNIRVSYKRSLLYVFSHLVFGCHIVAAGILYPHMSKGLCVPMHG